MIDVKYLFEIAVSRFDQGKILEAENLFIQLNEMIRENLSAQFYLAKIALELEQFEQALEMFSVLVEKKPNDPDIMLGMSRAYIGLKQLDKAHICLDRVQALEPKNIELHTLLSELYFFNQNFKLATQSATQAVSLEPQNYKGHTLLGDALLELGVFDKAIQCYNISLQFKADNWKAIANKGICYQHLGDLTEARATFTIANALQPLQPEILLPLTSTLLDLHQLQDANMIIEKLITMQPKNSEVLFYKGVCSFKLGKTSDAILPLVQALQKDDTKPEIFFFLSAALLKANKLDSAIDLFNRMIEEKKELPFAHAQKGETLLLKGEIEHATETVLQFLNNTSPDFPNLKEYDFKNKHVFLYSLFNVETFNVLSRFAPMIKSKGATVHLQCTAPIKDIIQRMDSDYKVYTPDEELPDLDIGIPLESLLQFYGDSIL